MRKWLNIEECAVHLGISKHTIYQHIAKRSIPFVKMPGSTLLRFDLEQIDEWMQSGTVQTISQALKGGKT